MNESFKICNFLATSTYKHKRKHRYVNKSSPCYIPVDDDFCKFYRSNQQDGDQN